MTTCRFLENLTLASLISPFPKDDFRTHYWEQKPLIVPRRDPDFYGDLFTLKDFDAAIARAPDHVNTANAGANKKSVAHRGNTVKGIEAVLADMRDGHTLMLDRLNECDPKLGLFCRLLGPELGSSFQTNLYLTPPHGQGSFPHWDNHDVFILQVMGSKRWKIEKKRRLFPGLGERMGEDGRELRGISTPLRSNRATSFISHAASSTRPNAVKCPRFISRSASSRSFCKKYWAQRSRRPFSTMSAGAPHCRLASCTGSAKLSFDARWRHYAKSPTRHFSAPWSIDLGKN